MDMGVKENGKEFVHCGENEGHLQSNPCLHLLFYILSAFISSPLSLYPL